MFPFVLRNTVTVLQGIVFVNMLLGLFPSSKETFVGQLFQRISDVLCAPARKLFDALGLRRDVIDWTPLFTILLLNIVEALIMKLIYG